VIGFNQPFGKQFGFPNVFHWILRHIKLFLSFDPVVPLLRIYSEETVLSTGRAESNAQKFNAWMATIQRN
jgi:hypothetical protein